VARYRISLISLQFIPLLISDHPNETQAKYSPSTLLIHAEIIISSNFNLLLATNNTNSPIVEQGLTSLAIISTTLYTNHSHQHTKKRTHSPSPKTPDDKQQFAAY
jgi:hypothetical protein